MFAHIFPEVLDPFGVIERNMPLHVPQSRGIDKARVADPINDVVHDQLHAVAESAASAEGDERQG